MERLSVKDAEKGDHFGGTMRSVRTRRYRRATSVKEGNRILSGHRQEVVWDRGSGGERERGVGRAGGLYFMGYGAGSLPMP